MPKSEPLTMLRPRSRPGPASTGAALLRTLLTLAPLLSAVGVRADNWQPPSPTLAPYRWPPCNYTPPSMPIPPVFRPGFLQTMVDYSNASSVQMKAIADSYGRHHFFARRLRYVEDQWNNSRSPAPSRPLTALLRRLDEDAARVVLSLRRFLRYELENEMPPRHGLSADIRREVYWLQALACLGRRMHHVLLGVTANWTTPTPAPWVRPRSQGARHWRNLMAALDGMELFQRYTALFVAEKQRQKDRQRAAEV